ncbi:uncharacterized protein TNIN_267811 [Trichonephila inaurata madagascariensis]|uniref:Vitellogenin n=1 Tax=Trichonephila inaurata madagascariensis TaxID=2747483 RepID=A0A8X6WWY2_9ARAC|nr:uncharacterized protein TNIN_267811 [Trichonephila inaurata madagascariensis]
MAKGTSEQATKNDIGANLGTMWGEKTHVKIEKVCKYPGPKEAVTAVQSLLTKITRTILERTIETEKTKSIGEHLVLLQKALTLLSTDDFKTIQNTIPDWTSVKESTEEDKIKRQIWLDALPLTGTDSAVTFITELIKENINKPEKVISLWESKNLLEALPMNLVHPNRHILQSLMNTMDILHQRGAKGYTMYYSASHLTVARVIRILCANEDRRPEEETRGQNLNEMFRHRERCPKQVVKKFITDIAAKLKVTTDKMKRVIYIETLCHTGLRSVIPIVKPYVNRRIPGLTPSSNDFVRSTTIFALHNLVAKHPLEIRQIVLPVYFNKTEPPKIRTAAFGVFARSYPSLGELQHVAADSWTEPSIEVGSYVTNSLETFGNTSDPCYQLTARRIKKVLPQVKRFHVGKHHAQNIYDSWFDTIRNFGLEHRYEMTPSNESFFPAAVYGALGYNTDTLKDYFYKFALNAQGFTSRNFHDAFLQAFNIRPSEDIPKVKIPEIFPEAHVVPRDPEFWRFTVFQKMFYINSYYYYDSEEHQTGDIFELLKEHFLHYFTDVNGRVSGHIVQVYMPSTYQTRAVGHALPYPVQFEMRNPLLLSWKFDIKPIIENSFGYSIDIIPSVYYSTLYSNQILNLGDCKHIGVYHEKKIAATYPFKVILTIESDGKMHFAYEFSELNKTDWLNAGWRRKSVVIKRIPDERFWTSDTKVEFIIKHTREFKVREKEPVPEDKWVKQVDFKSDESNYKAYGKAIYERIVTISHIQDILDISTIYTLSKTEDTRTNMHLTHLHTLDGALHTLHLCTTSQIPKLHTNLEIHSTFTAAFIRRPNEFKYGDESYERQMAILLGFVGPKHETFEDAYVVAGAVGRYKSLESMLNKELHKPAPKRSFLPETHEECIKDVKAGKPQSVHCLRAIYERAIYNHWDIRCRWNKVASCTLMDNYVRTYDMKTIHTPLEKECSYILTTHCLEHKKFAIIVTTDHLEPGKKKIIIYLGKHTIVLTPPKRERYVIKFDEEDHEVRFLQPIVFEERELIYAVSNVAADKSYFVEIHAEKVGIIVTYDGKNVKTQVDTRYKGELCGLCSEFNGEIYREMRGPKRCLYTSSVDFTKSNIVGKCGDKKPQHPYICANKGNYEWSEEHTEREYKPTLKRNIVLHEENRICFSNQAVPVCNRENSEVNTELKLVHFHCLPKLEKMTKKLVMESRRRILAELETKSTDMSKEVEIATECSV